MISKAIRTIRGNFKPAFLGLGALLISTPGGISDSHAQEAATGPSFVENFDTLDRKRWYISDGWSNGEHQNCVWSKDQVKVADGVLRLGFAKQAVKDREYACGEIQTNQRFSYGTFEVRMKAVAGSGLNTGFFTFDRTGISPAGCS